MTQKSANNNVERPIDLGPLSHRLGIEIQAATPERVTGTMPVAGNTQPFGLLHGGASAAFAETLASVGAVTHAGAAKTAVGVNLTITHHRPAFHGTVTGVARAVKLGANIANYVVELTGADNVLIATAQVTCLVKPQVASK